MYEARLPHQIAYFSMELALENAIPTYSGGLGVLAGDTLRSAADLGLLMVAVSLLYRNGHFYQRLDREGRQDETPVLWTPEDFLHRSEAVVEVEVEGRSVKVGAWLYAVTGVSSTIVPVVMLDTDLAENTPYDRALTDYLYGGDQRYRLCQETVLGIGGLRILRRLGFDQEASFQMNEGHSALMGLELLAEEESRTPDHEQALERVRRKCLFTTHTPMPAGHDQFPLDLAGLRGISKASRDGASGRAIAPRSAATPRTRPISTARWRKPSCRSTRISPIAGPKSCAPPSRSTPHSSTHNGCWRNTCCWPTRNSIQPSSAARRLKRQSRGEHHDVEAGLKPAQRNRPFHTIWRSGTCQ